MANLALKAENIPVIIQHNAVPRFVALLIDHDEEIVMWAKMGLKALCRIDWEAKIAAVEAGVVENLSSLFSTSPQYATEVIQILATECHIAQQALYNSPIKDKLIAMLDLRDSLARGLTLADIAEMSMALVLILSGNHKLYPDFRRDAIAAQVTTIVSVLNSEHEGADANTPALLSLQCDAVALIEILSGGSDSSPHRIALLVQKGVIAHILLLFASPQAAEMHQPILNILLNISKDDKFLPPLVKAGAITQLVPLVLKRGKLTSLAKKLKEDTMVILANIAARSEANRKLVREAGINKAASIGYKGTGTW